MPEVDLFAEDRAHELFVSALVKRLATEAELEPLINVRSAIGGHGRAIRELKLYQRAVQQGIAGLSAPDLLIVVIDANCAGVSEARGAIEKELQTEAAGEAVVACPDPHIERWFFADPGAFATIIGTDRQPGRRKCIRDEYRECCARQSPRLVTFRRSVAWSLRQTSLKAWISIELVSGNQAWAT